MTDRVWRTRTIQGLLVIGVAALLAGCGEKKTAAGNAVEMRDMEVVDGTINDSMTDLDAARLDGIGVGDNVANGASPGGKAKAPAPEAAGGDSEAVPDE